VLQAAGIELGSNYPLPIVALNTAKVRLQEALSEMWQLEAASRASVNNGMEESLGDPSEVPPIEFPQELHMETFGRLLQHQAIHKLLLLMKLTFPGTE
jgi:cryptochrome 1